MLIFYIEKYCAKKNFSWKKNKIFHFWNILVRMFWENIWYFYTSNILSNNFTIIFTFIYKEKRKFYGVGSWFGPGLFFDGRIRFFSRGSDTDSGFPYRRITASLCSHFGLVTPHCKLCIVVLCYFNKIIRENYVKLSFLAYFATWYKKW